MLTLQTGEGEAHANLIGCSMKIEGHSHPWSKLETSGKGMP
jgi:hypothetical protein